MPAPIETALRKYATQATTALSLVIGVTGVMLFFRIGKQQVTGIHEWLGLAFVIVAILHVVRHRSSLMSMLRQPRLWVLTGITAAAVIGFLVMTPAKQGGNPIRETTRLLTGAPLTQVAPLMRVTPEELAARLNVSDTNLTMEAIAKTQGGDSMKVLLKAMGRQPQ